MPIFTSLAANSFQSKQIFSEKVEIMGFGLLSDKISVERQFYKKGGRPLP